MEAVRKPLIASGYSAVINTTESALTDELLTVKVASAAAANVKATVVITPDELLEVTAVVALVPCVTVPYERRLVMKEYKMARIAKTMAMIAMVYAREPLSILYMCLKLCL